MLTKGDKVILTPVSYPTVKWEGEVIGTRKCQYLGMKYKVKYDCGGFILTGMFQEKEMIKTA